MMEAAAAEVIVLNIELTEAILQSIWFAGGRRKLCIHYATCLHMVMNDNVVLCLAHFFAFR